jgi:lipoprotein-anchoring transpeptidase ErfK/SrfK
VTARPSASARTALMASAVLAGLFLSPLAHANTKPSEGVVLVPPAKTETAAPQQFKRGRIVDFRTRQKPGSIVIVTREHALYYILGNGRAVKYRVATAKRGFEWSGTHAVSAKVKWPSWSPPAAMRKRRPELPSFMEGGPENPLGARAIYLGSSIYRIHGTNEPATIGKSASSGCIRMLNGDVSELFRHVKLGATVTVI